MTNRSAELVLADVLDEHFDELDWLWERREAAVRSADYTLSELAALEHLAQTHLDALRIGGSTSLLVAHRALDSYEVGAATAATFVLLFCAPESAWSDVIATLSSGEPEAQEGTRIALRHCNIESSANALTEIAASAGHELAATVADVLAFHRFPLPTTLDVPAMLCSANSALLTYGALARCADAWRASYIEPGIASEVGPVRTAALEAAARSGERTVIDVCRAHADSTHAACPEALAFLGVVGDAHDLALLERQLGDEGIAIAALAGLGSLGRVAAAPTLIEAMRDPRLARAAAAALAAITGFRSPAMPGPVSTPDGLSEAALDDFDDTPLPDADSAAAWWSANRAGFRDDVIWREGHDVANDPLGSVFDRLSLQARHDVYLRERAMNGPNTPDWELEARAAVYRETEARIARRF